MPNNKVLTKISELNLKNERAKQDIAKQFPIEQHKEIFIYELVRFDDPDTTFVANTSDGTINVSGFKFVQETIMYVESEFKNLFTTTGSQLTISDNRNIYGYLKEDLDYDNKSYFITPQQFSAGDSLKQVYMIDNNNQYDEENIPEIERIQLKPMAQELSFSNQSKWVLIDSIENGTVLEERVKLDSINITFKNPEIALSAIDISGAKQAIEATTTDHYLPFTVVPTSVVGNSINSYSPNLDVFANIALWMQGNSFPDRTKLMISPGFLTSYIGELKILFLNIMSICHMVQIGFTGVEEEGFAPGAPSTKIKPSAGWYWKSRLEGKEPKAIAAEIQTLIDLNMQATLSGQIYGDIDSNNVYGNIGTLSTTISADHWKAFYALLGAMYPQIFTNYTFGYGGGFDGDAIFPFKVTTDISKFSKGISYDSDIDGDDGSEMIKYSIAADLTITSNFSTPLSIAKTIDTYKDKSTTTIFYYEGSFSHRPAGEVYVIDYKYAKDIKVEASTGRLRNAQNDMITSANSVAIGKPNDWNFSNNSGWKDNVAGAFQIPQSVFETMDDPVFYYALTEEEIDDYYNEGFAERRHTGAHWYDHAPVVNQLYGSFSRGYPQVPDAHNIIASLKLNPNAVVEYFISANSLMRDDAGSNNDYQLVLQNPDITVRNLAASGTKIDFNINSDVSYKEVIDGFIPYTRPNASLTSSTIGKSMGINTDSILNAPKIFVKGTDVFDTYYNIEKTPYTSISNMVGNITKFRNQSYTFNVTSERSFKSLETIGLSTLGEGAFSLNLTFGLLGNKTQNIIINTHTDEADIYSNALYIDSDESFVNTYTLINFGEE